MGGGVGSGFEITFPSRALVLEALGDLFFRPVSGMATRIVASAGRVGGEVPVNGTIKKWRMMISVPRPTKGALPRKFG